MNIQEELKKLNLKLGSDTAIAKRLNVSQQTVLRMRNGTNKDPRHSLWIAVLKLAKDLKV